jgi:hypothetical protein
MMLYQLHRFILSSDRTVVNDELETMWKEALFRGTEENHTEPQSG